MWLGYKLKGGGVIATIKPFKPAGNSGSRNNNNRNNGNRYGAANSDKDALRINEEIRTNEVRLVGDNIEGSIVVSISKARHMAAEMELDLVEISPKADPPVCRIIDYQKYLYQQKKKAKEIKAKTVKVVVKEIRFGPNTDDHDYDFKLKHAINFLKEGSKVKAYVFFKGRQIVFKDQGEILLLKLAQDLEELAKVEQLPRLEGKKMILILAPKPKK